MGAETGSQVGEASAATSFVGRAAELGELRAALDGASRGRGELVLVTGEPGIGKTSLLTTLADEATAGGATVLWGAGWEGGGAPAHWPWVQALRGLLAARDAARLKTQVGFAAGYIAALLPEAAELLGAPPASSLEGEQARFSLFDAVARLLTGAASDGPVVLLLEDLHAADHSSLLMLEFVGRVVRGARLLVVGSYREEEMRSRPDAAEVLARAARAGRRIPLRGLSRDELGVLVRRQAGSPSRSLVERLHRLTDGNPFFADELVRLMLAEPGAFGGGARSVPLPDTVRETIRRRLDPVGDDVRATLSIAAVIGREFALDTLAHASGEPPLVLMQRLDEAAEAGIVEERGVGRHAFVHALVRETLYEELPNARAVELHRRVAEALDRPGEEAHLSELAHHFFLAAPGGEARPAVDYAVRAAEHAMEMLAFEHAAELYDLALRALDLAGPDEPRRCDLLLGRGDALMRAGQVPAAREILAEAGEVACRLRSAPRMARAGLLLSPWGLSLQVSDDQLIRLLEQGLAAAEDDVTRARLTAALAVALYWSAPPEERLRLVEEAIALARTTGDRAALARVLGDAHIATWDPESVTRSMPWAEELLAIADEIGDRELAVHAYSWRTSLLAEMGDFQAVEHAIAVFTSLAEQLRQPRAAASALRHRVMRSILQGRFDEVDELLDEQARLAGAGSDASIDVMLVAGQVFSLRYMQGRLAELEPAVRQFAEALPAMPAWRCALMAVLRDAGSTSELRLEYERVAAHGFESLPRDNLWFVALSLLAEACAELEDAEGAAKLEALLEPYAERLVVIPGAAVLGPVARALGLLALTRGDHDRALGHFEAAAASSMRMLARPMLAHLALDLARTQGARGDLGAARAELAEARSIAGELEMTGIVERADRVARTLGIETAPEPAAPPAAGAAPTTAGRELRRVGDHWTVSRDGSAFTLRDMKGLHHLATLLQSPGIEIHALDLTGDGTAGIGAAAAGDAGALLDPEAKAAYKLRIEDLQDEIEEAERFHDDERASRAREELDFIAHELSAAVGLGGRDRKAASTSEKARLNVTRAIKSALDRIAIHDPDLADELRATVRTGTFCEYHPLPQTPPWTVRPG